MQENLLGDHIKVIEIREIHKKEGILLTSIINDGQYCCGCKKKTIKNDIAVIFHSEHLHEGSISLKGDIIEDVVCTCGCCCSCIEREERKIEYKIKCDTNLQILCKDCVLPCTGDRQYQKYVIYNFCVLCSKVENKCIICDKKTKYKGNSKKFHCGHCKSNYNLTNLSIDKIKSL